MRPDDCTIEESTLGAIQQHVEQALKDSGAFGILPTPVDRIVAAAKLSVDRAVSLDDGFFAKLYRGERRYAVLFPRFWASWMLSREEFTLIIPFIKLGKHSSHCMRPAMTRYLGSGTLMPSLKTAKNPSILT